MKGSNDFNFAGNIEGNELFNEGKSDVIVCDGFVGNVILKEAEALYTLIKRRKIKMIFSNGSILKIMEVPPFWGLTSL
jgi:phosphate acyltransferase